MANRRRRFKLSHQKEPKQCFKIRVPGRGSVPVFPSVFKEAVQLRRITLKGKGFVGEPHERIRIQVTQTGDGVLVIRFFAVESRLGPYMRTSWSAIKRAEIYFR